MRTMKHWAIAAMSAAALALAGCGGGGSTAGPTTPTPDPVIGIAQAAATAAATAAGTAADAAEAAVTAQMANMSADEASYGVAQNAAMRARTAAAAAASAAAEAAAATTAEAAAAARDDAVEARDDAVAEQANAEMYAGMVQTAQNNLDAEAQRVLDVDAAVLRAETSYMEADGDADKAEMQADEAEATAPGSPGAMAARVAATAAREAATAAKAAHDAITDGMTKADADAQAKIAADQAMYANNGYMTAKTENNTIQTAAIVGKEQLEARDLAQAKADAEELYNDADDGVTFHYDAVVGKASDAAAQARAARMAADQAKYARTDATAANTHATAAETASNEADDALERAVEAKADADTARQAAMDATTSADAKAALADLKTANDALTAAHTGAMGAGMAYMRAKGAAEMAAEAQGVHVISLLIHANAQDLDLGNPDDVDLAAAIAKARNARHMVVGAQINAAVGMHDAAADQLGDRDQDSSTTDTTASTASATASWEGNDLDDEGTADVDESAPKSLSITVSIDGTTNLEFRTEAAEEDDDTTADIDETIVTATRFVRGLGNFYGYSISDRGNHAIVFTDKKQGADEVAAVTAVTARMVEKESVTTVTELSLGADKTGPTFTGVTWTPSGEQPLMGTLNCADAANCDIQIDAAGAITEIGGYTFTGSREAVAAVTAADATEDNDYLAFGVWLREDTNGDTEGTPKAFAAFANGGEPIADFTNYVTLTGSATYRGSATGVYTEGSGVDYFEGNAMLMANFGAPGTDTDPEADDDEIGTISGSISGIKVGGVDTTDVISLREANIVNVNTAFAGNARMGPGVDENNDDLLEYRYNGTWSGNLYGAVAAVEDDAATTDVDESMDAAAPEAVAGTFGVSGTEGEGDAEVTRSYVGAFGARR